MHSTLVCSTGSCCLAIPSLPDANILNQPLKASLLAYQLPTSGKGLRPAPWQRKVICQLQPVPHSSMLCRSLCTHIVPSECFTLSLRSLEGYCGSDCYQSTQGMNTTFWNCRYLAELTTPENCLLKCYETKSIVWVCSWRGILLLTLYSLGLSFLIYSTKIQMLKNSEIFTAFCILRACHP